MLLRRIARPLLAAAFVADGWRAVRHPREEVENIPQAEQRLAAVGQKLPITLDPQMLVRGLGVVKIGAGVLLGLGLAPRAAAGVLAVLQAPALASHPVWERGPEAGANRATHVTALIKDGALLGAALLAAADTAGKPSLVWRLDDARDRTVRKASHTTQKTVSRVEKNARRAVVDAKGKAEKTARRAEKAARKAERKVEKRVKAAVQRVGDTAQRAEDAAKAALEQAQTTLTP